MWDLAINNGITFKTNTYSLNAKYVKEMNEKGYSISSSLSQEKTDSSTLNESNTILNFLGNYFLNRSFSLGSAINYNVGEDKSDEGFTLSPRASIFITSLFHLDLLYSKFYADDPTGRNSDSYLIVVDHRF